MSTCFELETPKLPPLPVLLVAGAVLLDPDGRVLIGSRPEGKVYAGYWEFPGGKLEPNETPEDALVRELQEELGIVTKPSCFSPFTFVSYRYSDLGKHLLMPVFLCRFWEGIPQPREGQTLLWVRPNQFHDYKFVPGSVPLLPLLRESI